MVLLCLRWGMRRGDTQFECNDGKEGGGRIWKKCYSDERAQVRESAQR